MLRCSEASHADSDTVLLNMHNMYRSVENYFLSNNNNVSVNLKYILRHDADKGRRGFSA